MALDVDQDQVPQPVTPAPSGAEEASLVRALVSDVDSGSPDPRSFPLANAQGFLEAVGVALYTTDADGRITFFNEAAADALGSSPGARRGVVRLAAPLLAGRPSDAPRRMPDGPDPAREPRGPRWHGAGGAARRLAGPLPGLPEPVARCGWPAHRRGQRPRGHHRPGDGRGCPAQQRRRAPAIERGQGRVPRPRLARAADPGHDDLRQRPDAPRARRRGSSSATSCAGCSPTSPRTRTACLASSRTCSC